MHTLVLLSGWSGADFSVLQVVLRHSLLQNLLEPDSLTSSEAAEAQGGKGRLPGTGGHGWLLQGSHSWTDREGDGRGPAVGCTSHQWCDLGQVTDLSVVNFPSCETGTVQPSSGQVGVSS